MEITSYESNYRIYLDQLRNADENTLVTYRDQWKKAGFFTRLLYSLNLKDDIRERSKAASDILETRILQAALN